MSRYNDQSCDHTRWSMPKLLREVREYANFKNFSVGWNNTPAVYREGWHDQANPDSPRIEDFVRDQTRLYRETWLNPLLDEIERRSVKGAKA